MKQKHKQTQGEIYLENVIVSIKRQRRFNVENAHKTDLYTSDELMRHIVWFEEVLRLVKKNPPKGYVRTLLIRENEHGRIVSVDFELLEKDEEPMDVVFELV